MQLFKSRSPTEAKSERNMPSVELIIGAESGRVGSLVPVLSGRRCGGYIRGCGEAIVALFIKLRLLKLDALLNRWQKGDLATSVSYYTSTYGRWVQVWDGTRKTRSQPFNEYSSNPLRIASDGRGNDLAYTSILRKLVSMNNVE
jgi:hypothetical protein